MPIPLQITYRGMSSISSIDSLVQHEVDALERFSDSILRCHVTIGVPHRHHRNGRHYSVHLELSTPIGSIFVTRDPDLKGNGETLDALVRDAFDAATRQLQDTTRRRRSA